MAEPGSHLLQVNTSDFLDSVGHLKGELPEQLNHILRNVS